MSNKFVVFSREDSLGYVKIVQNDQRWSGNGADGATGTGFEMRPEAEVSAANYAVGLVPITPVVDLNANFAGRYVGTVPAALPDSDAPYGLIAVGVAGTIDDEGREVGSISWNGTKILQIADIDSSAILAVSDTSASPGDQLLIFSQDSGLGYAKIVQGLNRWAGNGTDGATGTGNRIRPEGEVAIGNYLNGLVPLLPVVTLDGTFAGRYVATVPAALPGSTDAYGVVLVGTSGQISDERAESGEFCWDGTKILSLSNVGMLVIENVKVSMVSLGGVTDSGEFIAYQKGPLGPFGWAIFDKTTGLPIDLTGKDLVIAAYEQISGNSLVTRFQLETSGGGLTVAGNVVTINQNAANTQVAPKQLQLSLRDTSTTPHRVYGSGRLTIYAVPDPAF